MTNWIAGLLPEESDDYILTVKDGDYIWVPVAYFCKGQWWEDYDGLRWMPA